MIHPFTHIEGSDAGVTVGADARIGPFARLRPGAVLGDEVHIGNFVEVKNSTLARGAKANHLAYVGDATLGERVNFGAGSITANYDGATIGGGSTISKNAPAGQLTVARGKQVSLAGWKRAGKEKGKE